MVKIKKKIYSGFIIHCSAIWLSSIVSYIKGGTKAKSI